MITNLEKLEYEKKLSTLGINFENVLGLFHDVWGIKVELSRELNISNSRISNTINGKHHNPDILYAIHNYIKTKTFVKWDVNLTIEEKRYDNLLKNGFSVWEAVQIANK